MKRFQPEVSEATQFIRRESGLDKDTSIDLGIILGSGLDDVAKALRPRRTIPFRSIPQFPEPSTAGQVGMVVIGKVGNTSVCCIQGRLHYYEGYSMEQVTFPVRMLGSLGIRHLIVTNAAGTMNQRFRPGDLMLIKDHISLFLPNPLLGLKQMAPGPRFPDLSQAYSVQLRKIAMKCAKDLGLVIKEGLYVAVSGPSYETPAEIAMLKKMGGDAVGMSTVPEVIVARQLGIECLGISVITNLAAGLAKAPLDHQEVLNIGTQVHQTVSRLIIVFCRALSKWSPNSTV